MINFLKILGEEVALSDITVSRNIAEVALQSNVSGESSTLINSITDYAKAHYNKVGYDFDGNLMINGFNKFSSLEVSKLDEMFIEDYNKFTGSSLKVDSTYYAFVSDLICAENTTELQHEDITGTNVYKFFNDSKMKTK